MTTRIRRKIMTLHIMRFGRKFLATYLQWTIFTAQDIQWNHNFSEMIYIIRSSLPNRKTLRVQFHIFVEFVLFIHYYERKIVKIFYKIFTKNYNTTADINTPLFTSLEMKFYCKYFPKFHQKKQEQQLADQLQRETQKKASIHA